jgi:hypothetical protein
MIEFNPIALLEQLSRPQVLEEMNVDGIEERLIALGCYATDGATDIGLAAQYGRHDVPTCLTLLTSDDKAIMLSVGMDGGYRITVIMPNAHEGEVPPEAIHALAGVFAVRGTPLEQEIGRAFGIGPACEEWLLHLLQTNEAVRTEAADIRRKLAGEPAEDEEEPA